MRRISVAVAAAALTFAATAQAFEVFKDYTPTKDVWNVTMVRVNPNRIDDYLEGLKQTWWTSCEVGKKHGTVVDCGIYLAENTANSDFNMFLVMHLPSAASTDPDPELYKKVQADIRAMLEEAKEKQLVAGYEQLRTFFGEMNFRRIDLK